MESIVYLKAQLKIFTCFTNSFLPAPPLGFSALIFPLLPIFLGSNHVLCLPLNYVLLIFSLGCRHCLRGGMHEATQARGDTQGRMVSFMTSLRQGIRTDRGRKSGHQTQTGGRGGETGQHSFLLEVMPQLPLHCSPRWSSYSQWLRGGESHSHNRDFSERTCKCNIY